MPSSPKLLDRVRQRARLRQLSYRPEQTYLHRVKRFVRFHAGPDGTLRHPRTMGEAEVTAFLNHPANECDVAASTPTQAFTALLPVCGSALAALRRSRVAGGGGARRVGRATLASYTGRGGWLRSGTSSTVTAPHSATPSGAGA